MNNNLRTLHLTLLAVLTFSAVIPLPLLGQKSSGEILGTVTDATGAVVPNVTITLINSKTNETRRSTSDELGNYRFLFVLPGTYSLQAEATGFQPVVVDDLVLRVDEKRRQDLMLQPGTVTEAIEVTASPFAVNAESPSLGNLIEERRIVELPLNGRSFLSLAYLSAGAIQPGVGNVGSVAVGLSGGRPGVAVSVSGMREGSNEILLDGIPSKHNFYSAVGVQPVLDGIAEFKVQHGYFSPEYGLPAVTNVVTKSGTNTIHGAIWEFLRNDKLDARNSFAPTRGINRQNQFGGAVGGPIVKNKVFYFGAFEGQRIRQSFPGSRTIVPTPAMLGGDFSALLPGKIISDPWTYNRASDTRLPFPGNVIPSARISPFARAFNKFIPPPTTFTEGVFNRIVTTRLWQNDVKFDIRGDWNLSESTRLFGRASVSNSDQARTAVHPLNGTENPFNSRNAVLAWTQVINPRLVSETRLGLDRAVLFTNTPEAARSSPDWPTELGLRNLNQIPLCNAVPAVTLAGYATYGFAFANCVITLNNNYHFVENMAYTQGRHNLTFGGQIIRVQLRDITSFNQNGSFSFTGQFSGDSAADYFLGAVNVASGTAPSRPTYRRGTWWNIYINDDFKISRDLTLNLGLRYQYTQPLIEKFNRIAKFDFSTGRIKLAGRDGVPRGLLTPDRNDVAPRVGFAWAPAGSRSWAIRGSYGIFYDRLPGNQWSWQTFLPPFNVGQAFVSDQKIPTVDLAQMFPDVDVSNPDAFTGVSLSNLSDRRNPYIQQWTFSVQRTLPGDLFAEAAYVGSKGTKLSQRIDANVAPLPAPGDTRPLQERRPYPKFSFILDDRGMNNSSYQALQFTVRKAYSRGLIFQTSYTWAKSLDGGDWGDLGNNYGGLLHRGRSAWDIRHRFVLGLTYELPFGKNVSGISRVILDGWELNTITVLQTGAPFHVTTVADPSDTGIIFLKIPVRTCDGNLPPGQRTRDRWFDTSCFQLPAFRTFGNAGIRYLDGPGYKNVDFSLNRRFRMAENMNLQFRAEFFNFFNHTNLNFPNATLESALFGRILGAQAARVIQFGLKLAW